MQQFLATIGISGSGKSTFLNNYPNESIISTDEIRKEFGDVSCQKNNTLVWKIAKERVLKRLVNGQDAILDATNVNSKNRSNFLKDLPEDTKTVALVFALPSIDEAFARVQKDIENGVDRSNVPKHAIEYQWNSYCNGYDNIKKQFDDVIYIDQNLHEIK